MKRYGKSSLDKQRWFCKDCKKTFLRLNKAKSLSNKFIWFQRWIVEAYSVRQLVFLSGYSRATLQRIIKYFLEHPPIHQIVNSKGCYLIFDGTFLHKRKGMYAAMDYLTRKILHAEYGTKEGPRDLMRFCMYLKQQGVEPKSITIDGNLHIFRAIKLIWTENIIQRCLVHIQRQGLSWCRQNPKRKDAKRLRQIFLKVCNINTHIQKQELITEFRKWDEAYGQKIIQIKNRGWVASDLQRARSMLNKAIPYMFKYLDDNKIPNTTNAIEGYFSRLKQRYRQHKGLSKTHRDNYFKWYFYLCPK